MSQYKIAVVVGSLRRDSFNRKFVHALEKMARKDFTFVHLDIGSLPLYNQDNDGTPSQTATKLKEDIKAAHGLIFATPEYNRSMPGVLKNALDLASRPYGQNAWAGKPAGIVGVSVGATGTAMAQQHLRNVLAYLDVPTLGQPEMFIQHKDGLFDAEGNIGDGSRKFVLSWMDRYVGWLEKHSQQSKS